jgi:class 3 adenylate cyclase
MSPAPPAHGTGPSQRALAAIVFTDVVSFSARMHSDEVGTLQLLQRDFAEMRRLCVAHEGAVLKTTGDGLLLTFTSAVQAVACALAIQRQFAAEAKEPGSDFPLQHRVGIHLGDVLLRDQDVMGDGVNIASRLQAEAEPGGICISQTVYDVVKNKLQMQVVSMGPRELKNIAQAMPAYRLVLEAQTLDPATQTAPFVPPVGSPSSRNAWIVLGVAAAAIVLAALFVRHPKSAGEPGVPVSAIPPGSVAPTPAIAAPTAAPAATDLVGGLASGYASQASALQQLHTLYLDKYDFNGMVLALRDRGEDRAAPAGLKRLLVAAEQMARLKTWLEVNLRRYNRLHPLALGAFPGKPDADASVYLAGDQRVVFLGGEAAASRDWAALKPVEFGAAAVSAIHEAKEVPRAVLNGALAFARLYSLPAMTEALSGTKVRRILDPAPK